MKSILILLIFAFGLFYNTQAYSQDKSSTKKEAISESKKKQNSYVKKLNLNEEQAQKFEDINLEYKKNVSALKIKSKNKKSVKKLKALEDKRDKEIKEILSEGQFEEFLELRREERNSLKTLIRKSNRQ